MRTKHTPGPWKVGAAPHGNCRIYADTEIHAIARTYGPDLNGIGVCALTGPENAADARLIAAAPDLLEALKAIVKSLADQDDEGMIEHAQQMIDARAAIAKAEMLP